MSAALPERTELVAMLTQVEKRAAELRHLLALRQAPEAISVERVLVEVAQEFEVEVRHLRSDLRMQRLAQPRQAVMALARELTHRSYPTIARILRRDHTTVISGCRAHHRRLATDPDYAARVAAVSERLKAGVSHV